MNDDEELYREMDEENDFYMGDREEDAEEDIEPNNNVQNVSGCLAAAVFLIVAGSFLFV